MPFPLSHWKNPRATIANKFEQNDIAYATHGAIIAMEALTAIDLLPSQLKQMTLLDYGCGTGRAARVLSKIFGHVYAYDPVEECIALAKVECSGIDFPNITYTSNLNDVPECSTAISINVIEHLTPTDARTMIANLQQKVAGLSYIWYFARRNGDMLAPYTSDEIKAADAAAVEGTDDRMMVRGFSLRD